MFVAGMAVVGMTHQLGWLLSSKEPLIASSFGPHGAASRAQSTNNLKQIALALHWYHEAHGSFPPGGTFDPHGRPLQSWQARILSYLDQADLQNRLDLSIPWTDPRNAPVFQTEMFVYLRPGIKETRTPPGTP